MRLILAPLAEFTDAPFRLMCAEGGADMAYTEMVSAAALAHGSSPTRHLLETMPGEAPLGCQLFGGDAADMARATAEIEKIKDRFVELNLNAGCPMPRIIKSGAGARLVEDPKLTYELLVAMKENTSLPVTLKTRLGPHRGDNRIFELADAAKSAGAAGLIVHARYTSQMHGGPLNLETLAEVVERMDIPVVGNGSVRTREDVDAMAQTGVAAVMIGRAALPDPAIFMKLKGVDAPSPWGERHPCLVHLDRILAFRRMLEEKFPDDHVPGEDAFVGIKMHTHLFRYFNGIPGAAKLRKQLNSIRTLAEARAAIAPFVR